VQELRARLADWRGVLRRQREQARAILGRLLAGRLTFTPRETPEGPVYDFAGQGSITEHLTGVLATRRLVTPAGFEPAISTLKGSRPGPG
jgi:hypothetical protein